MIFACKPREFGWFFKTRKTLKGVRFMALSVCQECQTVEGRWREPTLKEREEHGLDAQSNEIEDLVCEACDSLGSYKGVKEHDDYDMER